MTEPRVTPGNLRQLGPINWAFCRLAARTQGVSDMHIFSTSVAPEDCSRGWLHYSGRLMPFGPLSRRDTEMIIIRTAHLRQCGYELDHHLRMGRRVGIDAATADRITAGPDAGWGDRERVILTAVDELVTDRDISDATWAAVSAHLTPKQQVGLVLLINQYDSLATTIGTLRIERDQ